MLPKQPSRAEEMVSPIFSPRSRGAGQTGPTSAMTPLGSLLRATDLASNRKDNTKWLCISLHPSGNVMEEDKSVHCAFLIGPKFEAKSGGRNTIPCQEPASGRLAIADEDRVIDILRHASLVPNDPNFRCRRWIADALDRLQHDAETMGTAFLDRHAVETVRRDYLRSKSADGRFAEPDSLDNRRPKPAWDVLKNMETTCWRPKGIMLG
ncbi:hypothetical protein RJ55_06092 [Drechmeria coniospora]|nr:hypothetical protein RJ55_06092 [Drechmeria coniospora]